jgi:hypothetical protein
MTSELCTVDKYFKENKEFFDDGDTNAKKAFFLLGRYCCEVMLNAEEYYATRGKQNDFKDKIISLIACHMTYRQYTIISKACDEMAIKCDWRLFYEMSGESKKYIIQSECFKEEGEKISISMDDANTAFNLGMTKK